MNASERAVRLMAKALPQFQRHQREEEWLSDLDGCVELNISRRQVAFGALFAVIDQRLHPQAHTQHNNNGGTEMNKRAWAALRLIGYAVWAAAAAGCVNIFASHLTSSSGNTWGFRFPDGLTFALDMPILIGSLILLALAVALGARSFYKNFIRLDHLPATESA